MTAFAFRAQTGDGVSLLVGGLCRAEWTREQEDALRRALAETVFSPVRNDPYLTDRKLHRVVTQAAQACEVWLRPLVPALCAVTHSGAFPCGAILGAPFTDAESADGSVERLAEHCYAICFPGEFGAAFTAPDDAQAAALAWELHALCAEDAAARLRGSVFLLAEDSAFDRAGRIFYSCGDSDSCLSLSPPGGK